MDSVRCARRLHEAHFADDRDRTIEQGSVLDRWYLARLGTFDIVYSWGVLHHNGAMGDAIEVASRLVAPGGLFAFAVSIAASMCGPWRLEKRWYAGASAEAQQRARAIYVALLRSAFFLTRRDFRSYVTSYQGKRGVNFMHDVHDRMGGYPYESIMAPEVDVLLRQLGFERVHAVGPSVDDRYFRLGRDEYL